MFRLVLQPFITTTVLSQNITLPVGLCTGIYFEENDNLFNFFDLLYWQPISRAQMVHVVILYLDSAGMWNFFSF